MSQNQISTCTDQRIPKFIEAAKAMKQGEYQVDVPTAPEDELGTLGVALHELAQTLELRYREVERLNQITADINSGLLLDEILEKVYTSFKEIIPFNRIGFSLLEESPQGTIVKAHWARTDQANIKIGKNYSQFLAGSSLEQIIIKHEPRILNDLAAYLEQKPSSQSTRDIVEEGIRSSLTCPLIANGIPIGFIFFSSTSTNTYNARHIDIFKNISAELSVIVEKGRLVTQLAEQKQAIERQNQELLRLNELKNKFVGIAAHDLRSPLASIQMISNVLNQSAEWITEQDHRDFTHDIERLTEHMLQLLNDLLDVSQIEAGQLSLAPADIEIGSFLLEVVQRHAKLAAPKGTHILLKKWPGGCLCADPIRLRQVMDNLISNAVKFSPPGSRVQVRGKRLPSSWRIEVQDEGPGISPNDRGLLFQDFGRLSNRPTAGEKSTGLGLAICRRIIQAHGGKIDVDSEPGNGSTFWFTIPD